MCIAKTADTANRGKCIAAWNLEGTVGRYGTDQGIWRIGGTSYTGTEQRTGISTGIIVPAALLRRRIETYRLAEYIETIESVIWRKSGNADCIWRESADVRGNHSSQEQSG